MVRPDPVQPRRVLPERIHFKFHNERMTPTQALRELVQIVQVSARQQGRPFANVLEMVLSSQIRDSMTMIAVLHAAHLQMNGRGGT